MVSVREPPASVIGLLMVVVLLVISVALFARVTGPFRVRGAEPLTVKVQFSKTELVSVVPVGETGVPSTAGVPVSRVRDTRLRMPGPNDALLPISTVVPLIAVPPV